MLLKMREIDNKARISNQPEVKRELKRNQKRLYPWDIQLSSLQFLFMQILE